MTISLFSVPTPLPPPQARLYKHNNSCSPTLSYPSSLKLFVSLCTHSSTSSPVIEEEDPSSQDELPLPDQSQYSTTQSGCKACGREEIEKGCNGEGRIQGGIATVPGFGWWPIKAYRPCPGFVASGGRYRRKGQSMDEVASGGSKTPSPSGSNPSNKNQDPKKSKR